MVELHGFVPTLLRGLEQVDPPCKAVSHMSLHRELHSLAASPPFIKLVGVDINARSSVKTTDVRPLPSGPYSVNGMVRVLLGPSACSNVNAAVAILLDNGRHRLLVAALLACVLERAESAEDETLVSSRGDAKVLHVRLL